MRKFIIILTIFVQNVNIFAQKIEVLDKETSKPVPFAAVYFPDLKTGATTDENGFFAVENPQKQVLTQISCVGYKTFLEKINTQRDTTIFLIVSTHDLQEIIISAFASKLQGKNVVNVSQLGLHNAENQGINLADKLKNVAGLDNFSTGAGIGKPVIRGFSGNRIAVFSQGVRVENQQWGDEHGLGLDENGYENVEIIKGAASLLYGSDALGGVLFFTDERFANQNSIEASLSTEYQTNTSGLRENAAFKISKKRFHLNAFGGYTSHRDYADGNGSRVPNSRFGTGDFKTNIGYTGEKFVSSLKYNFLQEKFGLTEMEEFENQDFIYKNGRTPLLPFQHLATHILSSENTIFFNNNSKLKIDLGYVFNNRKELAESELTPELDMNLHTFSYNAKYDLPDFKKWKIVVGSGGMAQANKNYGEETLIPDARTFDFGLFGVANFHYSKKAYWQAGIRFDNRNINYDAPITNRHEQKNYFSFNFSTGIFQPLAENLSLRFNFSSGFRAPNMFELCSDGIHEGVNRYERGNLALKTENAYQADFSLNYKSKHLEIFANPYFNFIKNFICLQPTNDTIDNAQVFDYVQNNAMLYGGEAGFHFHPHPLDWLHLEGAYSSTFGQKVGVQNFEPLRAVPEYLPLMPAQKIRAKIQTNFAFKKILTKFSVFVLYQYSFAQNRVAEYETQTPNYHLVNCGVNFDFLLRKQKLFLNISANNLFNQKYFEHLSRYKNEGILNIGRNIIISLSIPFEWKI